jgi:prephenate dehydrogenase
MTATIIGIGLIGGSMALCLREKGMVSKVIGVDANELHQKKALELGVVDEVKELKESVAQSDIVIISVPVTAATKVTLQVLDMVDKQVVIDVGSTKTELCNAVNDHPNRGRFVATHPMWGTEFSGPEAATRYAFTGKAVVIIDKERSDKNALETIEQLYRLLGMHLLYMDAEDHDIHTAYISHISHITSFALANTVLEKEREEDAIFELASGGFESTVRLAKSNADTWVPIFMQNKENVLDVLNEHITQLRKFKASLEKENWDYLRELITHANEIKRILK